MGFNQIGLRKFIDLDKWGISSFGLKMIAVVTMMLDHMAVVFAADNRFIYLIMRGIGRLSFPIFCFLLVEGFFYTRNKLKHAVTLLIFAIISEVPYDMFSGSYFNPNKQNVMFTLLIGFLMIWLIDTILVDTDKETGKRQYRGGIFTSIIVLIVVFGCVMVTYVFNPTYTFTGILLILFFYYARGKHIGMIVSNVLFNIGMYSAGIQWLGVFSAVVIEFYNGKPGLRKWKYFFYVFYPVHLLLLAIIKM